ncbi:MAG: hypothetical protein M1826_001790 [Phylliscum demangeonii]|nr:MAG: hypothetical protein M1826_001790 [Phylliscum demangeonii]
MSIIQETHGESMTLWYTKKHVPGHPNLQWRLLRASLYRDFEALRDRYDALRQLMVLAIINDLLAPWHLLEDAVKSASATPIKLPWRPDAVLETPVFRLHEPGRGTTAPRTAGWSNRALGRLAELSGFAGRVTTY